MIHLITVSHQSFRSIRRFGLSFSSDGSKESQGGGGMPPVWDCPVSPHLSFIRQDKIDLIPVSWDEYPQ